MNNEIQREVATKGDSAPTSYYRAETVSSKENNQILRQMDAKEPLPKHVLPELVLSEVRPNKVESQLTATSKPAASDMTQRNPTKSASVDKAHDSVTIKPTDMGAIVRQDARPGTLPKDSTAFIPGTLPKDSTLVLPHPRLPQSRMPQWGPSSDTTGNNNPKPVEANVPKVSALNEKNSDMAGRIPYPTELVNVQKSESKPKY